MPPKRKDATARQSREAHAATATKPSGPTRKFRPFKLITSLVRIGICVAALVALHKRYTSEEISSTTEAPRQLAYEEIALDEFRSSRILDAFEVCAHRRAPSDVTRANRVDLTV
jgi:hypothetical protein